MRTLHKEPVGALSISKLPEVTLAFWVIKIAATTLGETGGDAVSMTMNLGYAIGTLIFSLFFLFAVAAQIMSKAFHPFIYWFAIITTTTVGTTLADFMDRSLGIGYMGGSTLLFVMLIAIISLWKISCGSVSVRKISSRKGEIFYWLTILLSSTLGTALGDFVVDGTELGYVKSALIFSSMLGVLIIIYFSTRISRTVLFWMAFILTRPLGATLGDFLTKAHEQGGLELDRISSSAVLGVFMLIGIMLYPRKSESIVV